MTIFLWSLLVTVVVASSLFLLLLFRLPLEDADFWLRPMTFVVLFFTFVAGGAALATGYFAGERQAEKILKLDKDLSIQQERAAKAEQELEETKNQVTSVAHSTAPQWAKLVRHMESSEQVLKSSPKGKVDIVYRKDSVNGFRLGENIGISLAGAGWTLLSANPNGDTFTTKFGPRPVSSVMELLPEIARLNWSDMVILSPEGLNQNPTEPPKTPGVALWTFLMGSEIPTYIAKDPTLPEDTVRLVITVP